LAFSGKLSIFIDHENLETKTKAEISELTATATHGDAYKVSDYNNDTICFLHNEWFPEGIIE